ncbi:MAG TPA: TadE/TadG family type IV pilus assembly protein [Candidatus Limnocylindria bacterium]|nr:TadE/TadG family type IV pilus assembly protein [Candidatus Limnocylindria bacterium]
MRRCESGQSLVEVALALPILLVALLGVIEIGRAWSYDLVLQNAAREGAAYASRTRGADPVDVARRVCDETGWSTTGSCPGLTVTLLQDDDIATVDASYALPLITGSMSRVIGGSTLSIHASTTFPVVRSGVGP